MMVVTRKEVIELDYRVVTRVMVYHVKCRYCMKESPIPSLDLMQEMFRGRHSAELNPCVPPSDEGWRIPGWSLICGEFACDTCTTKAMKAIQK